MMRQIYPYLVLFLSILPSNGYGAPTLTDSAHCETVELLADTLDCDESTCHLEGNARLSCEAVTLQADTIVIQLTKDFGFNGAKASGNVILVDRDTVVRCAEIELESGRIRGSIRSANIKVFANPAQAADNATQSQSAGTARALQTVRGDIHRVSKDQFTITDGTFTLCDCGFGNNPSWRLGAHQVDINIKDRATLWWPMLEFNFLGLGMLPLPLPTPVLSLPIRKRAAGLLAPSVTFLRDAYPVMDFPLFIPVGSSYDLTIAPGLRTDWGLHRGSDISTWAAPRLGARLRYAPIVGLSGTLSAQWTRDSHFTAARLAQMSDTYTDLEDPALVEAARQDPRWGLRDRVILKADHTWRFSSRSRWNLKAHWVSDDYIQRDFSFNLADQVAQYLPSRSRLDWHTNHVLIAAQIDYLQRLNNGSALSGYSNTSANEGAERHRAPSLEVWLRPQHLGHRFFIDAGLVAQRYGRLSSSEDGYTANRWDIYNQAKISYLDQIGPFQLKAQLGTHLTMSLFEPVASAEIGSGSDSEFSIFPSAQLQVQSTMAKRFGELTHMVQPFAALRYVAYVPKDGTYRVENPLHQLTSLGQMSFGVRQSFQGFSGKSNARVELEIEQPISIQRKKVMPTALRLKLRGLPFVQLGLESSIDWKMLNLGPSDLRASVSYSPWRFLRIFSQYGRLSSDTEVLARSIYEFSAITADAEQGQWMHYLRAGAQILSTKTWNILYQSDVLLPLPGDDSSERPQISNHLIRMGYRSPCDCWGVDVITQMVNPDLSAGFGTSFLDNMTVRVNLTIGDYTVGSL